MAIITSIISKKHILPALNLIFDKNFIYDTTLTLT